MLESIDIVLNRDLHASTCMYNDEHNNNTDEQAIKASSSAPVRSEVIVRR